MWAVSFLQFLRFNFRESTSTRNKVFLNTLTFLITLGSLILSSSLQASGYRFTDLGTLGGNRSYAFSINSSGQVVGNSSGPANDPSFHHHRPFLWNSGSLQDLTAWQDSSVRGGAASKINDLGQIAGSTQIENQDRSYATIWSNGSVNYLPGDRAADINNQGHVITNSYGNTTGEQVDRSFLHANGVIQALNALGGFEHSSYANALNNNGQVVGVSGQTSLEDGNTYMHATVWNDGVATELSTLGGTSSSAKSINNRGQIVGDSTLTNDSPVSHATIWEQDSVRDLGTLGGEWSSANGINNRGQVVGHSFTAEGTLHAFFYDPTLGMVDLNSFAEIANTGWVLTTAGDINERGQIIGAAVNAEGQTHAFLISPMPEPETYAMMLAGLGFVTHVVRRRKAAQLS